MGHSILDSPNMEKRKPWREAAIRPPAATPFSTLEWQSARLSEKLGGKMPGAGRLI